MRDPRGHRSTDALIVRVHALRSAGLSCAEVGRTLDPPVSAGRISQILRRGRERGVIGVDPTRTPIDEARVRAVYRQTGNIQRCASLLRTHQSTLKKRFGSVLESVRAEVRAERDAGYVEMAVHEYRALAQQLGKYPARDTCPLPLRRSIKNGFGSFAAFQRSIGIVPRKKDRQNGNK